jgi:hypothetical protein
MWICNPQGYVCIYSKHKRHEHVCADAILSHLTQCDFLSANNFAPYLKFKKQGV